MGTNGDPWCVDQVKDTMKKKCVQARCGCLLFQLFVLQMECLCILSELSTPAGGVPGLPSRSRGCGVHILSPLADRTVMREDFMSVVVRFKIQANHNIY